MKPSIGARPLTAFLRLCETRGLVKLAFLAPPAGRRSCVGEAKVALPVEEPDGEARIDRRLVRVGGGTGDVV
jgi:hypothetical protein